MMAVCLAVIPSHLLPLRLRQHHHQKRMKMRYQMMLKLSMRQSRSQQFSGLRLVTPGHACDGT
eukprot:2635161-Amphidinium_carterae.2